MMALGLGNFQSRVRQAYAQQPTQFTHKSGGIRIGTNIPGVKVAGTFFTGEGRIFYDFHDPLCCLTFELAHETYKQVVVEVNRDQDPATLAAQILSRLG